MLGLWVMYYVGVISMLILFILVGELLCINCLEYYFMWMVFLDVYFLFIVDLFWLMGLLEGVLWLCDIIGKRNLFNVILGLIVFNFF